MTAEVLQVISTTERRGAEVFAVDLGEALTQLGRVVRTAALVSGSGAATLPVATLGRRRLGIGTLGRLRREASTAGVVVGHGSSSLPACALARGSTPFVYRSVGDPSYWGRSATRRARVRILMTRARAVVALTPGAADALSRHYGVPERKLHVIPKGVPPARFQPADRRKRAEARRRLGVSEDGPVVVCVGALSPEKNVGDAVRAVAAIADAHLIIVGDGPQRPMLERLADNVAHDRVRLLGSVADPASIMAAADALVLPSLTEGLPGVLMEAGLMAIPAVATDVGWVREIVLDGRSGLVVPAGDLDALVQAIAAVLAEPADLGQTARTHCIAHFDIGMVAEQWDQLLAEL